MLGEYLNFIVSRSGANLPRTPPRPLTPAAISQRRLASPDPCSQSAILTICACLLAQGGQSTPMQSMGRRARGSQRVHSSGAMFQVAITTGTRDSERLGAGSVDKERSHHHRSSEHLPQPHARHVSRHGEVGSASRAHLGPWISQVVSLKLFLRKLPVLRTYD